MKRITKALSTTRALYRQFGRRGVAIGVLNKMTGHDLLKGISNNTGTVSNSPAPERLLNGNNSDAGTELLVIQQNEKTINEQKKEMDGFSICPLISFIMPIYNAPEWLEKAISSIKKQTYSNWQLCIVDDGSKNGIGYNMACREAKADKRILVERLSSNMGISQASNRALQMAKGSYVALIDQDDEITTDALFWMVKEINKNPDVDWLYSDECKIDTCSPPHYTGFFFKPDWSPEMMLNYMYTGHLSLYRKELVEQIGGFRSQYDFSQDYDLALRVSRNTNKIVHVERILYFWRTLETSGASGGKSFSIQTNYAALSDYFKSMNYDAIVNEGTVGRYPILRRSILPLVSIIVPSDNESNLRVLIRELLDKTAYLNKEIVIVCNSQITDNLRNQFRHLSDILVFCDYNNEFNFSDKCNKGAEASHGEVLLFLNDDAIPSQKDWMERMLDIIDLEGVGGVSPAMLYPNGCVQYAGFHVNQSVCGICGPTFHGKDWKDVSQIVNPQLIRDVSFLSGACMMIKKNIFNMIGGFNATNTPNGHSDIEMSIRLRENGLRCVYTPFSVLVHPGNGSWTMLNMHDKANLYLIKNYSNYLKRDPYFTKAMNCYSVGRKELPYEIIIPSNARLQQTAGDILLISHELSRTGAPVVLLEMAKVLRDEGYFVVVASPDRGAMLDDFLNEGVICIVDESLQMHRWRPYHEVPKILSYSLNGLIHDFDLVICNTFVTHNIVSCYNGTDVPLMWWLHEGDLSYNGNTFVLPPRLHENVSVYCGGKYVQEMMKKYSIKYDTQELLYGIEDRGCSGINEIENRVSAKVRFIFPASFEKRKNQELLLEAIEMLDADITCRAEFLLLGTYWDEQHYVSVKQRAISLPCVKIMEPISYDELIELYKTISCVVVPSLDDPMPVVLTEALMLSKIVLCSNGTGTSRYIDNGVNGFVFDCHNAEELANHIKYIVLNVDSPYMQGVRKNGRKLYERLFTIDKFREKLKVIIKELLTPKV